MVNPQKEDNNYWEKYVLRELERLNAGLEKLTKRIEDMNVKLGKIEVLAVAVKDLYKWRTSLQEVISINDLKTWKGVIPELRSFKVQVIAIAAIASFIITALVTIFGNRIFK